MLKLTTIEFFFRLIPEMMIFIWGVYVISKEKIKLKNYLFAALFLAVISFAIRKLPIHFGVHTILNNVLTICILIVIGIPIVKAIYSTLIMTLLLLVCEILDVLLLNILDINIRLQFDDLIIKLILGIPSLIFLAMFVYLINLYLKKEVKQSVSNGKNSY